MASVTISKSTTSYPVSKMKKKPFFKIAKKYRAPGIKAFAPQAPSINISKASKHLYKEYRTPGKKNRA